MPQNPFIIQGRAIDKNDIAHALAELQRVVSECQVATDEAIRKGDFDSEIKWAMMLSNAEITLSNIVDLFRKRFV